MADSITPNPSLTGSENLLVTLAGEGVTTVFGYPGGA
jgi:acetolactate synthase-1/2/3 large subunit